MQRALPGLLAVSVAACSATGSLFGDNVISVAEHTAASPAAQAQKNAASIRLLPYRDARNVNNPYKMGISTQRIVGMSGPDIMVQPEVAVIVTSAIRSKLDDAGFQLAASDALYELSGEVKALNYDVKARDEILIVVESTLKERATGTVVWSGNVTEKSDRFAGVSGNSKKDIANYLHEKVGVVAGKTAGAISASLMASRPDLFTLTQGARPVAGVSVLVAPAAHVVPPAAAPSAADNGVLLVSSVPPRAKIYIDDVYYGLTPLRLELAAGVHNIRAGLTAYRTTAEKVSVRKGEVTEIEVELRR
jgi:hypothetical protein